MRKNPNKRAYGRLTRLERTAIEEALSKRQGVRKIAHILGRSPSTIANEIKANRTIMRGGERGAPIKALPDKGCAKLFRSPGVCNPCKYYHHPCSYRLKVEYLAARADRLSAVRRSESRTGVDRSEAAMAMAMSIIRSDIGRGLSPAQISTARAEELCVSTSTIYRWVNRGYYGMSDLELRRKVGYKPRKTSKTVKVTAHGKERSYAAFTGLGNETCATAAEMDTVMGRKYDTQCILTLYLRPSRFQLALLLPEKTSSAVSVALDSLERTLGQALFSRLLSLIITDNGVEFANTKSLECSALGHSLRTTVYYCDVRQSQQKARCERAHVELRKLLPKNKDIVFDNLNARDLSYLMSQVNSEPRPSLGGLSPIELFKAQLKEEADIFLDALGITEIPYEKLDLTDHSIDKNRKDNGDDPLIHT